MSLPPLTYTPYRAPEPERPAAAVARTAAAFITALHSARGLLEPPEPPEPPDPIVSARTDAAFVLAAAGKARVRGSPEAAEPIEPSDANSAKADAAMILKLYNEHREANRR